ncbi:MAG: MarR family transcriptional regulator [Chloroflexi bacterium]|nr:MarR family transcriptional regulator [Chloroflexota bacterium]
MTTAKDAQTLLVWMDFLRAHQMLTELMETELQQERGISLGWYGVLLNLSVAPDGRLRLQELADRLIHSRSGLTRRLDSMVKAGLVTRELVPEDGRGRYAVITRQGRSAFRRAAPTVMRGIQRYFVERLGPEGLTALRDALDRLLLGSDEVPAEQTNQGLPIWT